MRILNFNRKARHYPPMTPEVKPPDNVLIVGCGDIGRRVAGYWFKQGIPVTGLTRNQNAAHTHKALGITLCLTDLDRTDSLVHLPVNNALVYYLAPPPNAVREDTRMQGFLASMNTQAFPERFVYTSTSEIYGDHQGGWVSEDTPPNPQVDRAHRRLHAETLLRAWGKEHQVAVIILRVGGIYGPGRLPIKRLQDQIPMLHEDLAPQTNRIHADDLAQVCIAAAERGQADQIYNVSDGATAT